MALRELDAARALLGVSPYNISSDSRSEETNHDRPEESSLQDSPPRSKHGFVVDAQSKVSNDLVHNDEKESSEAELVTQRRPRSGSEGLDCLAALAERERRVVSTASNSSSSSSDDDSEAMPPPPPRRRPRSVSNPDGMEKWNNYSSIKDRRHLVLPASVLEEELAEARVAVRDYCPGSPPTIPEDSQYLDGDENFAPDELLHRARSRLLEDLSESSINGEKGMSTLPHALSKYKDVRGLSLSIRSITPNKFLAHTVAVLGSRFYTKTQVYNKNGRIGIYTPQERAAIIARFNEKRSHRNWNKKIRYNCRKSLADRRLRVKGRFVKRSEQEQLRKDLEASGCEGEDDEPVPVDQDMPDVNDPEAGFAPTEDQPYRRLRRHTVT